MPVSQKIENAETGEDRYITRFVFKNNWFLLSDTEGEEIQAQQIHGWDSETALNNLEIQKAGFDMMNGNVQGYAVNRSIAINPVAEYPHKLNLTNIFKIL